MTKMLITQAIYQLKQFNCCSEGKIKLHTLHENEFLKITELYNTEK